jgi:signal peptidase I
VTESVRTLTPQELVAVAALWKRTGRKLVTRFAGKSMQPTIADGAAVQLVCEDDVAIGDIVAYVYGDRVIVHRIVAVWRGRFVTRGDSNVLPDPHVLNRDDVIGKVLPDANAVAPRAFVSSLLLRCVSAIAAVAGAHFALRLVGVLRTIHRRLRGVRVALRPE